MINAAFKQASSMNDTATKGEGLADIKYLRNQEQTNKI